MAETRETRLAALREELAPIYCDEGNAGERFVLVECSKHDGSTYLTSHASIAVAAGYHDMQEEPEDWPVMFLFDLDTGERHAGVTECTYVTTFAIPDEGPCRYCDDVGPHEGSCCVDCFDVLADADGWGLPLDAQRVLVRVPQ